MYFRFVMTLFIVKHRAVVVQQWGPVTPEILTVCIHV